MKTFNLHFIKTDEAKQWLAANAQGHKLPRCNKQVLVAQALQSGCPNVGLRHVSGNIYTTFNFSL
jgi:hypothetical protein